MEPKKNEATLSEMPTKPGWRIKVGFIMFIASMVWPVIIPILLLMGQSTGSVAKITGILMVVAEVLMLASVALTGKEGFAYIKQRIFSVLKSYGPPQTVSASRYKIGLILFTAPLLLAFLAPYIGSIFKEQIAGNIILAITGDIALLVSLFLLGGDFWEKLRSLFIYGAVVTVPDKTVETSLGD